MPDRRRYARTPDTICTLAALSLVGGAVTITGNVPASIADQVPHWVGLLWSATFALGAGVALLGVLWRDHLTGWVLELSGRIALAPTAAGYAALLAGVATHWGTAIVVSILAAIGVASGARIYQLLHRFRRFKAVVLAQREVLSGDDRRGFPWTRR